MGVCIICVILFCRVYLIREQEESSCKETGNHLLSRNMFSNVPGNQLDLFTNQTHPVKLKLNPKKMFEKARLLLFSAKLTADAFQPQKLPSGTTLTIRTRVEIYLVNLPLKTTLSFQRLRNFGLQGLTTPQQRFILSLMV